MFTILTNRGEGRCPGRNRSGAQSAKEGTIGEIVITRKAIVGKQSERAGIEQVNGGHRR